MEDIEDVLYGSLLEIWVVTYLFEHELTLFLDRDIDYGLYEADYTSIIGFFEDF